MNVNTHRRSVERGETDVRLIFTVIGIALSLIGLLVKILGRNIDLASIVTFMGGVFHIVFHNIGFWIVIIIAAVYGLIRKLTKPAEFMWRELPIQIGASSVVILFLYTIFFSTATNIADTEIWNGYVTRSEYYEAWTEEVTTTSTDKDGNTTTSTSYVYHAPEWNVCTTAGNFSSSRDVYAAYHARFGNQTKKNILRLNQSSSGDGDMYYVECDRNQATLMPASRPHLYVNYLKASDSIRKLRGNIDAHRDNLREYPSVYADGYGEIEVDRVIEAGLTLPVAWKQALDARLDKELRSLGERKQVNILVYVTSSPDRGFAEALKEYWIQGKKNDVIVILGMPAFPEVRWVEVIAWTKVEEFKIALRDQITGMKQLPDGGVLAATITGQVSKPPGAGGFERTPTADMEYLAADISLPWWCQVLIVLMGGAASWFTSHLLIHNDWRTWRPSHMYGRSRYV